MASSFAREGKSPEVVMHSKLILKNVRRIRRNVEQLNRNGACLAALRKGPGYGKTSEEDFKFEIGDFRGTRDTGGATVFLTRQGGRT
jgi:hypothetical protein